MSAAARQGDAIEHSSAFGGLLSGLAVGAGAALIGIAIVGTGGIGAAALAAMVGAGATTGAGIGQLIGRLSFACRETGQIVSGSDNVHINGRPAARAHLDTVQCDDHPGAMGRVAQGSTSVYINGQSAARVGDRSVCDAKICVGSANVCIGGGTATTDEIEPEVPVVLERALMATGLASALVLASPILVVAGMAGGIVGGMAGHWAGGELYGEGSDGQKLMALGGTLLGGGIGAKGGKAFEARYEFKVQGLGSNLSNVKVLSKADAGQGRSYQRKLKYFSNQAVEWRATRSAGTDYTYKVYQRRDIDWQQVRSGGDKRFVGKTNREAAERGLSPQLSDGSFVTLHHLGQKAPGPLVEASTRYHGVGRYGQNVLHSQYGRSKPHPDLKIDRKKFDVDCREYWQWRLNN